MEVARIEQHSCIKIAVLRGRNEMECHNEFVEALGNNALPYCTIARWVGKFQQRRVMRNVRDDRHVPSSSSSWMQTNDRDNKQRQIENTQQVHRHANFMCNVLSFFCTVKATLPCILP
ncbi:HTH_48 domain-containing protein [Trichonephila clavata]|uniref:HTH_48 domain-containing protein n=1 Tax=Trichonephila clavata TaxID=2740835 RepID=A0A8X6FVX0_TRICU|nr:HTH_48 domain-containing protein [Trichonephila clavata]